MTQEWEKSILRILNQREETVGTGFLVGDCLAVTCAHVILATGSSQTGFVKVTHYLDDSQEQILALVLPDTWSSPTEDDVAFIKLQVTPKGSIPARLAGAHLSAAHHYMSLGFPKNAAAEAQRAYDLIDGLVPAAKKSAASPNVNYLLQLKGEEVYYGMSGAPVFDTDLQRIVGMITKGKDDQYTRFAYATTVDTLKNHYPSLEVEDPNDARVKGQTLLSNQSLKKHVQVEEQAYPVFLEAKMMQVVISQLFRMSDFLTYPEGVREKRFYKAITDSKNSRRIYNRNALFKVDPYGSLQPIVTIEDEPDTFWRKALPDFRVDDSLCFIPFQLDLTKWLKDFKARPTSILGRALRRKSRIIQNIQLSGQLRIYPPGTGVIRMNVTIEFKEGVQVEAAGQLARDVENLFFIDENGEEINGEKLFLRIIKHVSDTFFKDDLSRNMHRHWRPPETIYIFKDFNGNSMENYINDLARLLSYAPNNEEGINYLIDRVTKALNSSHWKEQRIFYVTGQKAAVVILPGSEDRRIKDQLKQEQEEFSDTHDLVKSALYTERAFVERIERIKSLQQLDESWLPDQGKKFVDLVNLITVLDRVIQAINSIFLEVERQGKGELMNFAKDIWLYDNDINIDEFDAGLDYISSWLSNPQYFSKYEEFPKLLRTIRKIQNIPQPFTEKSKKPSVVQETDAQVILEKQLLDGIEKLEEMQDHLAHEKEIRSFTKKMIGAKSKLNKF